MEPGMSAIASFPGAPLPVRPAHETPAEARRRSARASEQESATRFLLTLLGTAVCAACIGAGAAVMSAGPLPESNPGAATSPEPKPSLVQDGTGASASVA